MGIPTTKRWNFTGRTLVQHVWFYHHVFILKTLYALPNKHEVVKSKLFLLLTAEAKPMTNPAKG